MDVRRLVIGTNDEGKSVFFSDAPAPNAKDFEFTPGLAATRLWATEENPTTKLPATEPTMASGLILPGPGGTSFMIIQYAPDSVYATPGFDFAASGQELAECSPDLAASMDIERPGMHRTDTVDFAVLLSGSIWIELDDGAETELRPGDTIVQLGGSHAWRNKSSEPATLAFVLVDATRA